MGDNEFILDNMTFSYSNLNSFHTCKYEWFLKYIECQPQEDNVYGQFGSFCHKILEMYENEELERNELAAYYKEYFEDEITEDIVFKTMTAKDRLYDLGLNYFQNIDFNKRFSPYIYETLGTEYECNFRIGNHNFVGYIDLLIQDKRNGDIIIIDHKSSEYPYNKNGCIKKNLQHKYNMYKNQLYLYSKAVYKDFGQLPRFLEWNYFKEQKWDRINFDISEYEKALKWAEDTISDMYDSLFFEANPDYFYCHNLCGYRNICPHANGG